MRPKRLRSAIRGIPRVWSYAVLAVLPLLVSTVDASGREFADLREVLEAYKGKIITSDMLDSAVKEELQGSDAAKSPGMLKLDLNGDGLDDLALLVKGSDPHEVEVRFYVCKKMCIEHKSAYGSSLGDTFLRPVKPGTLVSEPPIGSQPPKKVRLKSSGVEFVTYGKGALVYYWDEGSRAFRSIAISD